VLFLERGRGGGGRPKIPPRRWKKGKRRKALTNLPLSGSLVYGSPSVGRRKEGIYSGDVTLNSLGMGKGRGRSLVLIFRKGGGGKERKKKKGNAKFSKSKTTPAHLFRWRKFREKKGGKRRGEYFPQSSCSGGKKEGKPLDRRSPGRKSCRDTFQVAGRLGEKKKGKRSRRLAYPGKEEEKKKGRGEPFPVHIDKPDVDRQTVPSVGSKEPEGRERGGKGGPSSHSHSVRSQGKGGKKRKKNVVILIHAPVTPPIFHLFGKVGGEGEKGGGGAPAL